MILRLEERARAAAEVVARPAALVVAGGAELVDRETEAACFYREVLEELLTVCGSPILVEALVRTALGRAGSWCLAKR